MIRKSIYIFQVVFMLTGCSGYHIRNTYVIHPSSEEDLQRFHEAAHRTDLRLLGSDENILDVRDIHVNRDSTSYSVRNPWKPGSTSYNALITQVIPTFEVRSVTVRADANEGIYVLGGALLGGIFMAVSGNMAATQLFDNNDSWIKWTSLTTRCFVMGALLGGGLGMYVGESETPWDEYRFSHESP